MQRCRIGARPCPSYRTRPASQGAGTRVKPFSPPSVNCKITIEGRNRSRNIADSPGQGLVLHGRTWVVGPEHGRPSNCGGGLVHVLDWCSSPVPQVLVQAASSTQAVKLPSTWQGDISNSKVLHTAFLGLTRTLHIVTGYSSLPL